MSQFMYIQRFESEGPLEGLTLAPVEPHSPILSMFSGDRGAIWEVRPTEGALEDLADKARETLRSGGLIRDSILGRILSNAVARRDSFCLTWGNDINDLPRPRTESTLFETLAGQLDSDGSWNWELYVFWGVGA